MCAEETIGRRRGIQSEYWIQERTWKLIDEHKNSKMCRDQSKTEDETAKYTVKYTCLDCKVKKSCHNDKKECLENKGNEAQQAAVKNDMRALYRI